MYRPNLNFVALPIPEIMAISLIGVLGAWGCEPSILGKRRSQGVGDGTVRKSVGEFLYKAIHGNFSLMFTRFRDIAAFVLQHATFSYPSSSLPQISPCSPGSRWMALISATKSEGGGLVIVRAISFQDFQVLIHQRHGQTDGQTD